MGTRAENEVDSCKYAVVSRDVCKAVAADLGLACFVMCRRHSGRDSQEIFFKAKTKSLADDSHWE